jgi:2-polyprenyl-3-methyl-5-hydroxy-6-metoxy-1,4-benzoquinol methylase
VLKGSEASLWGGVCPGDSLFLLSYSETTLARFVKPIYCSGMPLFIDTQSRHVEPEWMDDPCLAPTPHARALQGLARINVFSRSAAGIWKELRQRLPLVRTHGLRVLDIACGGGDVALELERRAAAYGVTLVVDGCDLSQTAVDFASAASKARGSKARFFCLDALNQRLPASYDATVHNLFLHHLQNDEALALIESMSSAAPVGVISDLARGPIGYATALIGTRILSRSEIVHVDGPRSVRAAFTLDEARELARQACLPAVHVQSAFPFRWRMAWGPR